MSGAVRVCYLWDTGFIVNTAELLQRKGIRSRMSIYADKKLRTPEEIGKFEAESYFLAGNFNQDLLASIIAQSIRAYIQANRVAGRPSTLSEQEQP